MRVIPPSALDPRSPIAPGPVVRNAWYGLGFSADFNATAPVQRWVLGEPMAVYRTAGGKLAALHDRCPHRGAPLSFGRIEGEQLRCLYHGLCYGTDGRCVEVPGQPEVSALMVGRAYPVCERSGWVWVWMGDPAAADPALVPPAVGEGDTQWTVAGGAMEYGANHQLVHDNLCDLSHVAFVHTNTFGGGDERRSRGYASMPARVDALDRGIRVSRWMAARPAPPFLAGEMTDVDAFQTYDYLVPGVLLMRSALFRTGTAAALGGEAPPFADAIHQNFTSQTVTPMDERRTRYAFTWGPAASEQRPALVPVMVRLATAAFEEDRRILEAQQRMLESAPAYRPTGILHDRGLAMYRRVVAALAERESTVAA